MIRNIQVKLVNEFDQSSDNNQQYLSEKVDNFADSYTNTEEQAIEFLDNFKGSELNEILILLINRYNDNNLISDWIVDKIELTNEIVGYLVRDYYQLN
ncbi:hypothetical protein [Liquorilactobacillus hordei]|uniref:Uncharacterized protein n=1 Tax=Liquorilactobacillus hordei DSM 19519 TaxID=1423759 RepID=A0A0R1MJ85_9LACO|nr:hypothetical protein [Liquorilactobacillus hordei]KRL08055.1 hypothetical protein FC92_GL001129 [Liquorilactobacillus hordei DSM 19519]QYH51001.1 hypothetical protein G6O70_00100 [Liquorilactobacillus hordei DSM 19519]